MDLTGEHTITHRLCECLVVKLHDMEFEDVGKKLIRRITEPIKLAITYQMCRGITYIP